MKLQITTGIEIEWRSPDTDWMPGWLDSGRRLSRVKQQVIRGPYGCALALTGVDENGDHVRVTVEPKDVLIIN
jgi:hypothetical protein